MAPLRCSPDAVGPEGASVPAGKYAGSRVRCTLAALLPVIFLFFAGLGNASVFQALGIEPMPPVFSDMVAVLAAGEAHEAGVNVYVRNPLDPYLRPHVYGALWLVSGKVGLVRHDAAWLGPLLAAAFLAAAALVLAPRTWAAAATAGLLLASPGVLLGLERGNNDLVIFVLLAAAAALAARPRLASNLGGGALIALAMLLKFYPAVAVPALVARPGPRGRALLVTLGGLLGCLVVLAFAWADFQRVGRLAPDPLSIYSYGLRLGYAVLKTIPDARVWLVLGALPALAAAGTIFWRRRGSLADAVPLSGFTAACFVAGATTFLSCYLLRMNFPYRLIFLFLPVKLWLEQRSDPRHGFVARAQLAGCVVFAWLEAAKEIYFIKAGETAADARPPLWVLVGLEQALGLALCVGLALGLLGWARRTMAECGFCVSVRRCGPTR